MLPSPSFFDAHPSRRHMASGYALIEILMATLVLALGLTGMLQTQLVALRAQQQTGWQSAALRLATGMAEMIRAYGDADAFLLDYRGGDPLSGVPDCIAGRRCDPAALRAASMAFWLQSVQTELPQARVRICRDSAPYDRSAHRYGWSCAGGSGAGVVIKLGWRTISGSGGGNISGGDEKANNDGDAQPPQLAVTVGESA